MPNILLRKSKSHPIHSMNKLTLIQKWTVVFPFFSFGFTFFKVATWFGG
jgi:hypothetical protein